jgi:phosphatidylserine/phosphatidylglycerophosphate/cardiolipin synthase-like enzyme
MYAQNLCYFDTGWAEQLAYECALAQRSIKLCAMSMVPPLANTNNQWVSLWRSWVEASQRGVNVNMWLAAPQSMPAATRGNQGAGAACVRAGIGINFVRGKRLMHAKTVVIDDSAVWVGSGNFTLAACTDNYESFIRVNSSRFAATISERLLGLK